MKSKIFFLQAILLSCFCLVNAQSDELFFSEYIEGSSSNKAIEIYNPSSIPINLSNYKVYRHNNGSVPATDSIQLEGELLSGAVYVIGNPSGNATILAESDTLHTICFFNGDDAISLINKTSNDTLDIIGEIGVDPGSGWTVDVGATNNFTLIRKDTVTMGTEDWLVSVTEWNVFPIDMVDSLGTHSIVEIPNNLECELFFSEYIEGSGSNKAIEIFNPSSFPINLSNYKVYRYNNGSVSATDSIQLEGELLSGSVYIIGNPSGNATILAESDTLHTICFFNGDDAVSLINKTSNDTLDIIGEIGVDPGSGWVVGGGFTNNNTLVRKGIVNKGNTNWAINSTQWEVHLIDMVDSLGVHNLNLNCLINVWNGIISDDWFTDANWNLNHVPNLTEEVYIPSGTNALVPLNELAEAFLITIEEGGNLTVNGEIHVVADP